MSAMRNFDFKVLDALTEIAHLTGNEKIKRAVAEAIQAASLQGLDFPKIEESLVPTPADRQGFEPFGYAERS